MKKIHVAGIIALIVLADQALKVYIKTHYTCGKSVQVLGEFFTLDFIENPGMAYGLEFGGNIGKMALTIFRFAAVIFGTWYMGNIIKKKYHKGFIFCAALIYAGALGNLIDSAFYGMIFDKGMYPVILADGSKDYVCYEGVAKFSKTGYQGFLHGNVVDMLHFTLFEGDFPKWFPFWGGRPFEFFRPIFNLADAAISVGVFTIFIFQKRFFRQRNDDKKHPLVETGAVVNDEAQVL